jgi:uncharacterized protein YlxP (DUF503 family)
VSLNVELLLVELYIGESLSLKDKRRILQSLQERLRRSFNVAVAEVEFQDQWQRSRLALVLLNTERRVIQSTVSKILEVVGRDPRVCITRSETERLC